MKVTYFFCGIQRKSSVANSLAKLCRDAGFVLLVHEIDILIGGKEHDLMDTETQQLLIDRIAQG